MAWSGFRQQRVARSSCSPDLRPDEVDLPPAGAIRSASLFSMLLVLANGYVKIEALISLARFYMNAGKMGEVRPEFAAIIVRSQPDPMHRP